MNFESFLSMNRKSHMKFVILENEQKEKYKGTLLKGNNI